MAGALEVYLEEGSRRTFACSLDWPGWCRSGRGEEAALAALAAYAPRYAPVAREAGLAFLDGEDVTFEVVERLPGSMTTDFGAIAAFATVDARPLSAGEAEREARLVEASWWVLDRVAAGAPASLRKGPRGGGRDRDAIIDHVLAAETAYVRKLGLRLRQPAADDAGAVAAFREALLEVLRRPSDGTAPVARGWPSRYAARRLAWHALDHAWEIEDKSEPGPG
ncbi:MAG TPA: hypothetical protein VIA06_24040 [Candidatus Dormibacteraeota bacterium]|nr:hypothetical protein [Candidatus Dormibacteraeota bacterium]